MVGMHWQLRNDNQMSYEGDAQYVKCSHVVTASLKHVPCLPAVLSTAVVSDTTVPVCLLAEHKSSPRQCANEWSWLCPKNTLFTGTEFEFHTSIFMCHKNMILLLISFQPFKKHKSHSEPSRYIKAGSKPNVVHGPLFANPLYRTET